VIDREVVVQDLNSQRVGEWLSKVTAAEPEVSSKQATTQPALQVWDCCAASGGKSIMAADIMPSIRLTVSDVRESIISNLKKRFENAGLKNYRWFVADLSNDEERRTLTKEKFDLVIADLPCTGSGTWSRTPEQLYFFNRAKIEYYSSLQKRILKNVLPYLAPTGCLLYITCSVFRKENEMIVQYLENEFGLRSSEVDVLKGYDKKADTMFAALLYRL
jgi:16S rRNA (cytosine967-C5)-methyltransferase